MILAKSHPLTVGVLVVFPPLLIAALQLMFWPYIQPYAWILFYPGIFLSSFFGGMKGGMISTALAAMLVVYLFIPPEFSFVIQNTWTLVPVCVFLATGVLFSFVHDRLRNTTRELTSAIFAVQSVNEQLEIQVKQRTTELLQSNVSLRESEVRLNTIVENLGEGVVVSDMKGQLLHSNLAAIMMLGFKSREENLAALATFTQSYQYSLLDTTVLDRSDWPLNRVLRGETLRDFEVCLKRLGSDWQRIMTYRGSLVRDSAGEPMMAVITMRDVTDSRQSEIRFRALIEHSSDGISLIDADNKILYLSPGVVNIEGYTPEELLHHSGIEHTHPDDVPKIREVVAQLLANPRTPVPVLWRRRHKNGNWLWLEGIANNLLDDPAVKAIVTNYRNVTNRIVHEERIRVQLEHLRLLDHITRAVAERQDLISIFQVAVRSLEDGLPIDFGCVMIHDPVVKNLRVTCVGVKSAEIANGLMLEEQSVIAIDKNGMESCMQGKLVYEPDIDTINFPFPMLLAQGGLGSIVMAPLRSESHVFGMLVAARKAKHGFSSSECEFLRQLSEHIGLASRQTQLNIALQQAYDDLRQSQEVMMEEERLRALGQMASGIAHDINNALTPVLLYADTMLEIEDNISEESRGYLETIKRSVEDVAHTVARLREFYRQRDEELKLVPVQMNNMVEQIVDLTRARWSDMPQQRGVVIKVKMDLAADLPKIWGVESEMREALTNLVFNAVDAMPDGGNLVLRSRVVNNTDNAIV
ncbi:MAG: PAS domain S-box protein, partial [Pseudomonadota bacterium]